MPDPNHDDAKMRATGARLLADADLGKVRLIGVDEAKQISMRVQSGETIPRGDMLALALWAAKGGLKPT